MNNPSNVKLLISLDDFKKFEEELTTAYPFIHNSLPFGIDSILDSALQSFKINKQEPCVYIEECVNLIDYIIADEESNNKFFNESDHSAVNELYTAEFYDFLMDVFNLIHRLIQDYLMTSNFEVIEHDHIRGRTKMIIQIKLI